MWKTKKVRSFFSLKDKNLHPWCKTYFGLCLRGEDYVGETKRDVSVRYDEHNKPSKKSKPAAHLEQNIDIISVGGFYVMHRQMLKHIRILRHFFIEIMRLSLNERIDCHALILFRNGVTWSCVNSLW